MIASFKRGFFIHQKCSLHGNVYLCFPDEDISVPVQYFLVLCNAEQRVEGRRIVSSNFRNVFSPSFSRRILPRVSRFIENPCYISWYKPSSFSSYQENPPDTRNENMAFFRDFAQKFIIAKFCLLRWTYSREKKQLVKMFGVTPVYSFGVLIRNIYVQPITAIERLNLAGDDRVMRILLGRLSSTNFLVNNLLWKQ